VIDLIAAVAARWPDVRVEPDAVARALADRELAPDAAVAIDIALVCALAARDPGALAVFENELVPDIRGPLVRVAGGSADLVEEALQRAREKLLVAKDTPRIVEFRGRGSLAAWIQVLAIREVLMLCRRERRNSPPIEDTLLAAVETDPVLALTKRSYRTQFAAAFHAAFAELEPRQRALLRLTFAEAAGTEKLAAMYGVHRVTMFRWLADARADLLDKLRANVATRIGIATGEIDSLIRAVASSLDLGW
jgi:RNA polymerase sigma-70 factor (ECF subfamily)